MFNTLKIVGLLTLLTLLLIAAARVFFGPAAVVPALLISLVMNFGAWWFSDRIALSFAGAKPVTEAEAPDLYRIVSYLAQMAQWSMWFGGGDRDDRDSGSLGMIGMILGIILLPLAAVLVQLAISRSREYGADDESAALTHDPLGLASALRKLEAYNKKVPLPVNPAVAPL